MYRLSERINIVTNRSPAKVNFPPFLSSLFIHFKHINISFDLFEETVCGLQWCLKIHINTYKWVPRSLQTLLISCLNALALTLCWLTRHFKGMRLPPSDWSEQWGIGMDRRALRRCRLVTQAIQKPDVSGPNSSFGWFFQEIVTDDGLELFALYYNKTHC